MAFRLIGSEIRLSGLSSGDHALRRKRLPGLDGINDHGATTAVSYFASSLLRSKPKQLIARGRFIERQVDNVVSRPG